MKNKFMFNYDSCKSIICLCNEYLSTVFLTFIILGVGILLLHVFNRLKDWYRLYKLTKPPLNILFETYPLFRKTYLFDFYNTLRYCYPYVIHGNIFIGAMVVIYYTRVTSVIGINVVQLTCLYAVLALIFGLVATILSMIACVLDAFITDMFRRKLYGDAYADDKIHDY